MQQPGWYLQRLKVMSGAEVAHRLSRKLKLVSSQFRSTDIPARDDFATDLRFLPPFVALAPEALIGAAEKIVAGRYSFFDLEDVELGNPPQWNKDPLTHRVADVIGPAGVHAIFLRAVKLRKLEFAFLDECIIPREGLAESLRDCLRKQDPEVIQKVAVILFATFAGLLATVVGEHLSWSLLQQIWPDTLLSETELQEAEE